MAKILLPLTGAIIGWITNVLAIRLLFRPQKALRLWPLPISVQGLIPRRRAELALSIGEVVAQELFNMDELIKSINIPELQSEVEKLVKLTVEEWCSDKMSKFPAGIRTYCSSVLRDWIAAAVAKQFPHMAESIFLHLQQQVDVAAIVTSKVNALSLSEVEELILRVSRRELKQIEWLGAVLGFIIGLLQLLVI
ncbi:MAG: DUF445 family protein [Firmicutes bacterium]|nr:DUF445 family protein [Bacillota bacterium]